MVGEETDSMSSNAEVGLPEATNADEDYLERLKHILDEGAIGQPHQITLNDLIDEETWNEIGKNLEDFDFEDMKKLHLESPEMCETFYRMYARAKGFGVRRNGKYVSKRDGKQTTIAFICSKQGRRLPKFLAMRNRKRAPKPITRCGCKAEVKFRRDKLTDSWKVCKFVQSHNHRMTKPEHMPFERSCRNIPEPDRMVIKALFAAGFKQSDIMRSMVEQAGGYGKVGYLVKDLYNLCDKLRDDDIKEGDAETAVCYLLGKKAENPAYYVNYTKDAEGRLDKLFWSDPIARADYKAYGQCLVFDTTYKSNAYKKPFVMFVGVNNHWNMVPFGCALIANEKEETYEWVLNEMIRAGGSKPLTIITDGDKAIGNAVKKVIPTARHRLCLWHIMRNVKSNGGREISYDFKRCVDQYRTVEDFEQGWAEFKSKHNVFNKRWAIELERDKHKWSEAYLSGYFFAGMRSSQRCESMHHTLKTVFQHKLKLYKFVQLYDVILDKIRNQEMNNEYTTLNTEPVVGGVLSSVRKHAATVYTRNSYARLCKEMTYESRYTVKGHDKENLPFGETYVYWLEDCENTDLEYTVLKIDAEEVMYCCCMKFESVGIPCRHMFAVMKFTNMTMIPEGLILHRWTSKAKDHIPYPEILSSIESESDGDSIRMARSAFISSLCTKLHRWTSVNGDYFNRAKTVIADLINEFEQKEKHDQKKENAKSNTPQKRKLGIRNPVVIGKSCNKKSAVGGTSAEYGGIHVHADLDDVEKYEQLNLFPPAHNLSGDNVELREISAYIRTLHPLTYTPGAFNEVSFCAEVEESDRNPLSYDWNPTDQY